VVVVVLDDVVPAAVHANAPVLVALQDVAVDMTVAGVLLFDHTSAVGNTKWPEATGVRFLCFLAAVHFPSDPEPGRSGLHCDLHG
jgi:hypothetical protein